MSRRKMHDYTNQDVLDILAAHPYGISVVSIVNEYAIITSSFERKPIWEQFRYVLKQLVIVGKVRKEKTDNRTTLYFIVN